MWTPPRSNRLRNLLLLVNPVFLVRSQRRLPSILSTFSQAGVSVDVRETLPNRDAAAVAAAAAAGFDTVVVCGGDGTIFDVLQSLAGSELPLGIIPFGTGNILAQNLGMPRNPVAAARRILSGKIQSTQLGKLTCRSGAETRSWYFAMSAGMGAHAAVMTATRRARKARVGRAAYFAVGLRQILSQPSYPFEIEVIGVDGRRTVQRVFEAIALRVSRLNLWRTGGGLDLPFLRLASVAAGAGSSAAASPLRSLINATVRDGQARRIHSPVLYQNVVKVTCRPLPSEAIHPSPIPIQADGEVLGDSYATIEMAGRSLRLITGII